MAISTEHFVFDDIEFKTETSREISNRPRTPQVVGLQSATVICVKCAETWHASQQGRGRFHVGMGEKGTAVMVDCPSCDNSEAISFSKFQNSAS